MQSIVYSCNLIRWLLHRIAFWIVNSRSEIFQLSICKQRNHSLQFHFIRNLTMGNVRVYVCVLSARAYFRIQRRIWGNASAMYYSEDEVARSLIKAKSGQDDACIWDLFDWEENTCGKFYASYPTLPRYVFILYIFTSWHLYQKG